MLEASDLCLGSGDKLRVDRLSFRARPAELSMILGPNGAGKSSVLSLLSGWQQPESGSVSLGGQDIRHLSARALARQRAVVSQHPGWQPGLTVEELVGMGAYSQTNHHQHAVLEVLALMQCQSLATRRLETLSGGERQRAHLAQALLQLLSSDASERYLLLDEPTAALDFGQADWLLAQLRQLARQHAVGVVLVIHDLNLALRHADQVLLMNQGQAMAVGPVNEVMQKQRLETIYGIHLAELMGDNSQHRVFIPLFDRE